jgi:hypothetical protein
MKTLTVIRHFFFHILAPEHKVVVPFSISEFAMFGAVKVWNEGWWFFAENVKVCEELHGESANWA